MPRYVLIAVQLQGVALLDDEALRNAGEGLGKVNLPAARGRNPHPRPDDIEAARL